MEANGTLVPLVPPEGQTPTVVDGQLLVNMPLQVGYYSVPEYRFDVDAPGGGFHGWVAGLTGPLANSFAPPFTIDAPLMSGILWTQRFVRWEGTVSSTTMSLVLPVNGPYTETAIYAPDYGAVACVIAAALILVLGSFMVATHRFSYRGAAIV